ncbi:heat shock protein HSS1 [Rhizophagus clarus]|uniref:Heat shock protein HSS1 n=1 Tax=Rhizophagus clarus TaxID=94130 RepID=A0A8H3KS77_9GLOM|nr:heat shock protein HSS1 [Rhizophagus clarus]
MRDVWGPMLTAETFSAKYKSENKDFTLKEIISTVFVKLKETAEDFLSTRINNAVVTIPACFNNVQCQAIRDAGLIAGLNVLYIIIGSTAAAISYWLNKRLTEVQNILVFDFGSITLDVSLLTIELGFFKIVAITSDAHLGNEDFDNHLVNHFAQEFKKKI